MPFGRSPRCMVVLGDLSDWNQPTPACEGIYFHEVSELDATLLRCRQPDIIISPLFNRSADALEIALLLGKLSFRGRYLVIADQVPELSVVSQDLRDAAPQLDVQVVRKPARQRLTKAEGPSQSARRCPDSAAPKPSALQ